MMFPLLEKFIWTLVVLLIIIIVFLVIFLKVVRNRSRKTVRKDLKYKEFAEKLLIQFLYADKVGVTFSSEQKKIIKKFKKGLPRKRKRKIMTATFFDLRQEVSGEMVVTMQKLVHKLGLLEYAVKKLKSKKWYLVAEGIRDLRQFKVTKVAPSITKLINHKREEVRREAYLYFLELFELEGLNFLYDLKEPLSEWDQIRLLGEIKKIDDSKTKDILNWLKSENDYVVLFVLSIVKLFNLLETKEIMLSLLQHANMDIKLKTIEILAYFEIVEAKEILINKYGTLSIKEKLAFFDLLEKTATKEDALFAMSHIEDENFEIRYKALCILKKVDTSLYEKLEKNSEDESHNKIIHFIDYSYGV